MQVQRRRQPGAKMVVMLLVVVVVVMLVRMVQVVIVLMRVMLMRVAVAHHNPDPDAVVVPEPFRVAVIVARDNARRIHDAAARAHQTVDVVAHAPSRLLLLQLRLLPPAVRRVGHRAGALLVVLLLHLLAHEVEDGRRLQSLH